MKQINPSVGESTRATINLWPDAARLLGVGRNTIYKAAATGEVPVVRIGKRLLVPKAALLRLLNGKGPGA
ncbi:MAG: helix-turn-helix domain-containing protein [Bryobacterales bacterium]|nr:helix-turn-helix domain-containing protein [Bryobacterales bacterium]